ncbi:hypothetical protein LDENG_00087610 [Lucifuga dentata]|nr:hypothetical protein LDENG_00087610 [Lucifuga dentata]
MNPYRDTNTNSRPHYGGSRDSLPSPPPYLVPDPCTASRNPSASGSFLSPPAVPSEQLSYQTSSVQDGGFRSRSQANRAPVSLPAPVPTCELEMERNPVSNPYPSPTSPRCQVSIIIPSPDLRPSPIPIKSSEASCPDLECSICFSHFNNVFRCPKMLQCKHTFCLECLARINIKSTEPNTIQCPLCRGLTPLPALGLPKLTTDSDVLPYLPAAMQRVYSIRFLRSKGKLQVKRSSEGHCWWGQRSPRSRSRSLDVGLPSPPVGVRQSDGGEAGGVGGALFRLTGRPACRAFLLTSVVMTMALLMGVVIFLLTIHDKQN